MKSGLTGLQVSALPRREIGTRMVHAILVVKLSWGWGTGLTLKIPDLSCS